MVTLPKLRPVISGNENFNSEVLFHKPFDENIPKECFTPPP